MNAPSSKRPGVARLLTWRTLAASLALLAVLAWLLPLAATRLVGRETLRRAAEEAMTEALGRAVRVGGDVRLTMVPWLGLRAGSVEVAGEPSFGPEPLLTAGEMAVGLDIPALFARRVAVESVSLDAPQLHLGRDEEGRPNWALPGLEASDRSPGRRGPGLPRGLRLERGAVHFTDRSTGASFTVRGLNLHTTASRPFKFSVSFSAEAGHLDLAGEFHAKGVASYSEEGSRLHVHKAQAAGWLAAPGALPGAEARVLFSTDLMVHGDGAVEAANLVLEGLGARVTGQVNLAGLWDADRHLLVDLKAQASPDGLWREALRRGGLAPGFPVLVPAVAPSPSLRAEGSDAAVRARLKLAVTPAGWVLLDGSLSEGAGVLEGTASGGRGRAAFDVTARGLDLTPWAGLVVLAHKARGGVPESLTGRFQGSGLRAGEASLERVDLTLTGAGGALRLYPFTVNLGRAVAGADVRLEPGQGTMRFKARVGLTALEGGAPGKGLPQALEASAEGESGPAGTWGVASLEARAQEAAWRQDWIPELVPRLLEELGAVTAQASFRAGAPGQTSWEVTDLDARLGATSLGGSASWTDGQALLDLRAGRLDLEELRRMERLLDAGKAASFPLELRLAAGRLDAGKGLEVDDLSLTLRATPEGVRVPAFAGAALGGRFSGSLELTHPQPAAASQQHAAGQPPHGAHAQAGSFQLTLAAQGVQGARLAEAVPLGLRATGPLDARLSLEGPWRGGLAGWQSGRGQLDMQMGQGGFQAQDAKSGKPWPVTRAQAQLRIALKPAPGQGAVQAGEKPRETVQAELVGPVRLESPSGVRSAQADVRATAGLDEAGRLLWVRQPRLEGSLVFVAPGTQGRTARASWAGRAEADCEKGTFSLSGVEADVAGLSLRGQAGLAQGQGGWGLSGALDVAEFNPRDAAQRLGLELPRGAGPQSWRRARFQAELGGTLKDPALTRVQASLDDAALTGQVSLAGTRLKLDLAVTGLDLDLLAPEAKHLDVGQRPEEPLPMNEMRELDLDARIRLGRLKKDRLVWENALVEAQAQGGRFLLRQTAPSFYGGPYSLELRGDARGDTVQARVDIHLTGFSAPVLLRDLADGSGLVQGTTNFHLSLTAHGATDRQMRRNSQGQASFEVQGGLLAIRDADGRPARNTPAPGVKPKEEAPVPPPPPGKGLAFTRMGASFTVHQGLGVTRDFVLAGQGITAKGDGWVSLVDERIDLNLIAQVPDVGEVPVRVSGPLYDPKMDVDKSKVIGDTIVNVFKGLFNIPGDVLNQFRRVF
ncbi:hypothetical protein NNJEOMEG_00776 [Fundidesulfovibrio magnetotacticus]|uniref:AsmA domain-containing protein n=1 Tax=Fundidesulfovibrio magnetotacticus TaxID=2730080 RepID=A0A6V8LRI4_9BACT|nr:AsmA family protein [Fundidesulfovibrio magnetotacticus]GFK92948.1 hypothetical protein NNJEOMEG_00776 [Fundidesulfovibrio magnetotacticus]